MAPCGRFVDPPMAVVITQRQRYGIVGAAVLLLVVVTAGVWIAGGDDGSESAETAAASAGAVESELPTAAFELFDGGTTTFAEFEGRPLVINFWASWCPACVAELPEFQTVHEERGDSVTFLGLANADIRPAALDLAGDVGLTYTLADDPNGDLFREFGLIAMPSTLFISPDGQIVEVFGGQLDEAGLNDRIDALLEAA